MSTDTFWRYYRSLPDFGSAIPTTQFREITKCVVRKDHSCGKFLGASKSCFIACPSTEEMEEVETILALITEKLTKIGIEPVIAIKERAYGQDIFCTKICGKIIESQFCLVMLDDTVKSTNGKGVNIPNPNVYYEYGLMTALNKHVIPLQKEGQRLAFNIQTHDTIKYTPHNLSMELDRAFKDAVKITQEDRSGYQFVRPTSQRLFSRSLEINGYQRKGYNWFLADDLEDTVFAGYGHPERREYLFFTVTNDKESVRASLIDMQVIIKRLEPRYKKLSEEVDSLSTKIEKLNKESKESEKGLIAKEGVGTLVVRSRLDRSRHLLEDTIKKREEQSLKVELIENSKFAIILTPELMQLKEKIIEQYDNIAKDTLSLPLYIGDISSIQMGDLNIPFKSPEL